MNKSGSKLNFNSPLKTETEKSISTDINDSKIILLDDIRRTSRYKLLKHKYNS